MTPELPLPDAPVGKLTEVPRPTLLFHALLTWLR